MAKQLFSRHLLFTATMAGALLSVVAAPSSSNAPRFRKIGDFKTPKLAGWKPDVIRTEPVSRIRFRKEVQENRLSIAFATHDLKDDAMQHVRKLQSQIKTDAASTVTRTRYGVPLQITTARKATTLNGMPAVLTQELIRSKQGISKRRVLVFAKGKGQKIHLLNANISSRTSSFSPQAQAEFERAWKKVAAQIQP